MKIKKEIEASLLAFDFSCIPSQLDSLKAAGINIIHYDVMDHKFVNNTAFGTQYLDLIHDNKMVSNVHFMVNNPQKYLKKFMKFPMNLITFHPEPISLTKVTKIIKWMHQHHLKAGLAFKPTTDISIYESLICQCQAITIMGVNPGKGGQPFLPASLINLKQVYQIKQTHHLDLIIQFDGGVNFKVIDLIYPYVDHFVSGSFLMNYPRDKKEIINYVNKIN